MLSIVRDRLDFDRLTGCTLTELWRLDVAVESVQEAHRVGQNAMQALLVNPQFQHGLVVDD